MHHVAGRPYYIVVFWKKVNKHNRLPLQLLEKTAFLQGRLYLLLVPALRCFFAGVCSVGSMDTGDRRVLHLRISRAAWLGDMLTGGLFFLIAVLNVDQAVVDAAVLHEIGMRAAFHHFTVGHHQDLVRVANG